MARCLFTVLVCVVAVTPCLAQSSVSGTYLIEPVVGRFFSSPSEDATVFGARATWRRSYDRSYYVSLLYGGGSDRDGWGTATSETRLYRDWTHVLGTLGIGSTLIDRDATGHAGLHILLGIGYVASTDRSEWVYRETDGSIRRDEFRSSREGPVVSIALTGELELFSPKIVLRGQGDAFIGVRTEARRYEGLLWFPGASLTAGVAIGL